MSSLSKLDLLQSRIASHQFVFKLDPLTLLPIDLAAPACGKSASTFRMDVTRRPSSLPKLTRIGRRVFVKVGDLLSHINQQPEQEAQQPQPIAKKRRGRRTNAEKIARAQQSVKEVDHA